MDILNYNSLCFLACFIRLISEDDLDLNNIFERVLDKTATFHDGKYFFKNNFKLIKNSNCNSNIKLGLGYTKSDIYDVIISKICIDEKNKLMPFSLFRSKIKIIDRFLNKHDTEDGFNDDNYDDYDSFFVKSNNHDVFPNRDDSVDILKNPHDISLESTRSDYLWKNMFEVIVLEALFVETTRDVWKKMFFDHSRVMISLRSNIELNIYIHLCMLKLDATTIMFNLMNMIRPYDHMKYDNFFNHDKNTDKIKISSQFMLMMCIHYHSDFKKSKHEIKDVFKHLIKFRGLHDCSFCHDYDYFFRKSHDFTKTPSVEEFLGSERFSHTILFSVAVLKKVLYLSRMFYGKSAVKVIESVVVGSNSNFSYGVVSSENRLFGVQFKPIRGIKGINGDFLRIMDNRFEFDIFKSYPLLCIPKWKHADKCQNTIYNFNIDRAVNVCKIPFLSDILVYKNFCAYLSEYFNNGNFKLFGYNPVRKWPCFLQNGDRPHILLFKYIFNEREHMGMFCDNGMLFHTLFLSFNNSMISYNNNVFLPYPVSLDSIVSNISNSLRVKEHDMTMLSSIQNSIGVYGLGGLLGFKEINFIDSDYERTFVFNHIMERFQKHDIWKYLIEPYIAKTDMILNINSLEVTNFSEIGSNIYASIQCFFGNYDVVSRSVIDFKAIKLIESVTKSGIYYNHDNGTYMHILYMMPVLKRCIAKSYEFYINNPQRNYIPICIFDDDYLEISKMFFMLCCMDMFSDDEAVFIFLSIRVNEQIETVKQREIVKKINDCYLSDDGYCDKTCSNVEELLSGLMYISAFCKKFNMNFDNGISISSFDDIIELHENEVIHNDDRFVSYGNSQYVGNVAYFQKMTEMKDMFLKPKNVQKIEKKDEKPILEGYFFPVPIYLNISNGEIFDTFERKIDIYANEDEISMDLFRKKDFSLFIIPNDIISFLNSIDNCNRTFFEF